MRKNVFITVMTTCLTLILFVQIGFAVKSSSGPALKGTGEISGTIMIGGQNVVGGLVYIPGKSFMVKTDDTGSFHLYYVPVGTYHLIIEVVGYTPFTVGPYTVVEATVTAITLTYACYPGYTQACPLQLGVCSGSVQTCGPDGNWSTCNYGPQYSLTEICGDNLDNDCNGQVDEGCYSVCTPGTTLTCYTGPTGTLGVGICRAGTETCNSLGTGYGGCNGQILPTPEICGDGIDNNCNGVVDELGCTPP